MASSLSNENTDVQTEQKVVSSDKTGMGKKYVTRTCTISSAGATSDITLYTVPAGRTFYLTSIITAGDDNNFVDFNDSAGNVASGTVPVAIMFANNYQGVQYSFSPGIRFETGLTVDSTKHTLGKFYRMIIQGYLV
jgi:hypothetical protein